MLLYRRSLQRLKENFFPLVVFTCIWKILSVLILAPALAGMIQLSIRAAGLKYLTNATLGKFMKSPWAILLLLIMFFCAAIYTFFEISAVTSVFDLPKATPFRKKLRHMFHAGFHAVRLFFRRGNPLLIPHILLLIPLIQFSAASGVFSTVGVPDFLSYYFSKKEFLIPIYIAIVAICSFISIHLIFSTLIFTRNRCTYKMACQRSRQLTRGNCLRTYASLMLWNVLCLAILLLVMLVVSVLILLGLRIFQSKKIISSQTLARLQMAGEAVIWIFSFFGTSIEMAHIYTLKQHRSQRVKLSETMEETVSDLPFSKKTTFSAMAVVTAIAVVLNLSYLHSLFTDTSALRVTFFQTPTVMAHRGLSSEAPENTLYAFDAAIQAGADYIELDVQETKDNVLVIMHDSNLYRTTGVDKDIWDVNYDEMCDLDAGSWFDPMYANATIPTLEQVFQFVDHRIKLNIEIKRTEHNSENFETNVADLIAAYGYENECYVTSFDYSTLKTIKLYNENIHTGFLMSSAYGQFYSLQYADAFSMNQMFITSQMVSNIHRNGKKIFAWTVNDTTDMRKLKKMHVDSIITDTPVTCMEVFASENTHSTLFSIFNNLLY